MDTFDMALLVLGGVLLSMAGQMVMIAMAAHAARIAGEPEDDWKVANYLSLVLWPMTLAQMLGAWVIALVIIALVLLTNGEPPDDDTTGGSAC